MSFVSVQDAKRDFDALLERVRCALEPTVITGVAGEQFVILPIDQFNAWQETAYLLSNPANAEHLRQSVSDAKGGKVFEHELIES
jgi:antitoxin YefM